MKNSLVLLGAPGSGKGTQAKKLAVEFGYHHVSTGDLLREEISLNTPLGQKVKELLANGQLVDDETVFELLKSRCSLDDSAFIFDGFPRSVPQVHLLEKFLENKHECKAIYLHLPVDVLIDRLTNRRICTKCGAVYNLLDFKNTPLECKKCGEDSLIQREDDRKEVITDRQSLFEKSIQGILSAYKDLNKLVQIEGNDTVDNIYNDIKSHLRPSGSRQ